MTFFASIIILITNNDKIMTFGIFFVEKNHKSNKIRNRKSKYKVISNKYNSNYK